VGGPLPLAVLVFSLQFFLTPAFRKEHLHRISLGVRRPTILSEFGRAVVAAVPVRPPSPLCVVLRAAFSLRGMASSKKAAGGYETDPCPSR